MASNQDKKPDLPTDPDQEPRASPSSPSSPGSPASPSTMLPTYTAPDWFVSSKVKTLDQIRATEPKIFFLEPEENDIQDNEPQLNPLVDQDSAFVVSRKTFRSIHDTLASCFVPNPDDLLSTRNNGVIIECGQTGTPNILDEYVTALAKELGTAMVTLTARDLEALAAAYDDQTPTEHRHSPEIPTKEQLGGEKYMSQFDPSFQLACQYFGYDPAETFGYDPAETFGLNERSQQAFAATLSIDHEYLRKEGNAASQGSVALKMEGSPLMVYLPEIQLLFNRTDGNSIVAGIVEFIVKSRNAGKQIVLVATYPERMHIRGLDKLKKKGKISASAIFRISYIGVPSALKLPEEPVSKKVSRFFVDRLKSLLRFYARQYFDPKLLLPDTQWDLEVNHTRSSYYEGEELIDLVMIQVMGRAVAEKKLGLEDIAQVLSQVEGSRKSESQRYSPRSKDKKSKANSNLDAVETRSGATIGEESTEESELEDEEGESALEDDDEDESEYEDDSQAKPRRQVHRSSLDGFEKNLVSSLIEVDQLQDTKYEHVILSPYIKEMMRQLILLSKMKMDIKSPLLKTAVQVSGALLYGPPGTGKTHLSRAIANSLGSNMLALDAASLQSKWVGETEKYIRAAFSLARKYEPCILFLDEVDALFYRRGSEDTSWRRAALTQFLQEMDGLKAGQSGAPFVLVATNRPMDLDTAFLRRLPQKMYFGLPDEAARAQILRVLLNEKDLGGDVDLNELAALTPGYSGSDLKNLCSEAALLWVLELNQRIAEEVEERAQARKVARTGVSDEKGPDTVATDGADQCNCSAAAIDVDADAGAGDDAEGTNMGSAEVTGTPSEEMDEVTKRKMEKAQRKMERAAVRKEREERRAAKQADREAEQKLLEERARVEEDYKEKLTKVCLTKALFEKALQRMRPTVSRAAVEQIEQFARQFSDK